MAAFHSVDPATVSTAVWVASFVGQALIENIVVSIRKLMLWPASAS